MLKSSTTAAVIIPKPSSAGQYYIVTVDEQASNNGVRYNLVDMSLQGGLGDIVPAQKNKFVYSTTSEKLQVVPTADGCGYWLIAHDNPGNTFASFKITQDGIQPTPVLSSVGGTHGNGAGHMKINRQFNKLALGNFFDSNIELFDFDPATGVISNPVIWHYNFPNSLIYGVEFSPDGSKLYVSNIERIVQYDISQPGPAQIEASGYEVTLGVGNFYQPATLQLGPDNKIYIAAGFVDVINTPNSAGADCGFQQKAVPGQIGLANYGLPQWIYFNTLQASTNAIVFQDTCLNTATQFSIENPTGVLSYAWNFADPNSGLQNSSSADSPSHLFSKIGDYNVQVILNYNCFTDTLTQSIRIAECLPKFTGALSVKDSCATEAIGFSIKTDQTVDKIEWNFGDPASGANNTASDLNPSHLFAKAGTYPVIAVVYFSGGIDTISQDVKIENCNCKFYVPNAFSPNGDGSNDTFSPIATCPVDEFKCAVFNRWGELVFETSNPADKWDGKHRGEEAAIDVYAYLISYKIGSGARKTINGDLTLLR